MRMRWWSLACLGALLVAGTVRAEERHLDFLNGLRELRYYDYALVFLDQLEARSDLPAELKEILPYERARTLLDGAQFEKTPEAQLKQLDNATLYLQQFIRESPNHPRAAQANSELAEVLVRKGRVEVLQARSPSNVAKRGEFMNRARGYFNEARKMYQAAFDAYTKRLDELPKGFIEERDPRAAERESTLVAQIQAEYHLYLCTYDEAQTYEAGDEKRRNLLLKAANDFEKLHQKHRSVVAGLYARMHQGKCFEEMGDITKALGIYNELLGHGETETDPTLKRLQDHVLHFKLICLNHESKNDHQVVIDLATEWIRANRDRTLRTPTGLGIRWERARAYEQLGSRAASQKPAPKATAKKGEKSRDGEDVEITLPEADLGSSEKQYRLAETDAQYVNRFPGEYREPSSALIKRMRLALGKGTGDPKDFDSAYQAAKELIKQIPTRRDAARKATGADKESLQKAYVDHVTEAIRICKLAVALDGPVPADKKEDRQNEVNRVRYFLSFAYYSHPSRQYGYDAALTGEFIAKKHQNSLAALEAAYLAMAAWQQAYATSDAAKRAAADPLKSIEESKTNYEIQRVIAIANYISEKWPNDDKAQDARMNLGDMYLQIRQPAEAAKVFQQVPLGTQQYLDARLKAGIALWDAAASNPLFPPEQQLPAEEIQKYPAQARKILEEAITQQEAKQPADAPPGDQITLAKLSLVQILNGTGAYDAAIKHTTEGPKSVLQGAAAMEGKRGETIRVATRTELLRAYVGAKQVEKAREQLKELERLGGTEGLTGILVNLGKELKKELERLEQAKDPRLAEVLQSFEAFLGDLAGRKDGQDYGSLMWVGQTYFALGEGIEKSDPAKATGYFSKSAEAYEKLIAYGQSDPKFIPEGTMPGVTLRLITSRRREKRFDEAQKLMAELLKTSSNALDIQTEAAQIYQDRAAQGGPEDWKYWEKALAGDPPKSPGESQLLWGWNLFGEKLRTSLFQPGLSPKQKAEYEAKYLEVRYNVANCRLQFARNQPKDADKEQHLAAAQRDIANTALQIEKFGERPEYATFNELYRTVQEEHNSLLTRMARLTEIEPVKDLEKNSFVPTRTQPETKVASTKSGGKNSRSPSKAAAKPPEKESNWLMYVMVPAVVVLGAGGAFLALRKPKRKKLLPDEPIALPPAAKKPARTKA